VILTGTVRNVMTVRRELPARTVQEFIALAKAQPGRLSYASSAVRALNAAFNRALEEPTVRQRLAQVGVMPVGGAPERLREHIRAEVTRWAEVVRRNNIRAD
jgi:tripartite-type tricarboxylate transporter receptor subunit TctC